MERSELLTNLSLRWGKYMINLTNVTKLKFEFDHDQNTGLTTVTILNQTDVNLGEIVIETVRAKYTLGALAEMIREQFDNRDTTQVKPRTNIDLVSKVGVCDYDVYAGP